MIGKKVFAVAVAILSFSIAIIPPVSHAADINSMIPESIAQSGQNAWSAIVDFMTEVWRDTANIAEPFFEKITADIHSTIGEGIKFVGSIRGWLAQFIPPSLKRALTATTNFFSQISEYLFNFIKDGFFGTKSGAK